MTIFECDLCKKQKACSKTRISDKTYDLCAECKKSLDKKLEGRGEFTPSPVQWWPYQTWYGYLPSPSLPVQPSRPHVTYTYLGNQCDGTTLYKGISGNTSLTVGGNFTKVGN